MLRFRHVTTGREVSRPEPGDEPVRRRRARALAIAKLDRSRHWERVEDVEDVKRDGFDPSEHGVREVNAYLADYPDERERVLAAEEAGKARSTILNGPYAGDGS